MIRINIKDLRAITEKLFDHMEELQIEYIDVSKEYYWHISADQRYDMYKQPYDLTVGQLSDDWQELHNIVDQKTDPIAYHFVWLSSILRYIGEDVVH